MSGFSGEVLEPLPFEGVGFESESKVRQQGGGSCVQNIFLKEKIRLNRSVIAVQRFTEPF